MQSKSQKYAALRKRGQREISNLEKMFRSLDASEQTGQKGQRIREQQAWIREASEGTKLRGKRTPKERLHSAVSAGRLEALIPERYGGRSRQDRENRMFRAQVRHEEEFGLPTSTYGGEAGEAHYERIFYMSTESIWSGKEPQERDQAIMDALGVDSLEEAYKLVIDANKDAVAEMRRRYGKGFTKWEKGDSDPIMAYIVNATTLIKDR